MQLLLQRGQHYPLGVEMPGVDNAPAHLEHINCRMIFYIACDKHVKPMPYQWLKVVVEAAAENRRPSDAGRRTAYNSDMPGLQCRFYLEDKSIERLCFFQAADPSQSVPYAVFVREAVVFVIDLRLKLQALGKYVVYAV